MAATTFSASGNATVGGTFGVTGTTSLNGDVAIGNASGDAITIPGTISGALTGTITSATITTLNGATFGVGSPLHSHATWFGTEALGDATTAASGGAMDCVAVGYKALKEATGSWNTAIGEYAGFGITSGTNNVCVGSAAGQGAGSQGGGWNVAVGSSAFTSHSSGDYNVCIGNFAGSHVSTGDNNIMIGYRAGMAASPAGVVSTASHIICLGDDQITNLYCNDTSISSSDGRDKADVEDFTGGLDWIEAMRPVTYQWDKRSWYKEFDEDGNIISENDPDGTHKKDKKNIGFIAQEVLEIEKSHGFANDKTDMLTINLNEDDTAYGMKYERLVPILVNAIKELLAKVKALESK